MTFDAGSIEATLKLNRDQFQRDLASSKQEGQDFEGTTFEAELKVDDTQPKEAAASTEATYEVLRENLQKAIDLKLETSGFAEADAEIEATKIEVDSLNRKRLNLGSIFGAGGGGGGITSLLSSIGGFFGGISSNISEGETVWSGLASSIIALAPVIVAVLTPLLGIAGALGAAFAGAAASVGGLAIVAAPLITKLITDYQALSKAKQQYDQATTSSQRTSALQAEAKATDNLTGSQKGLFGMLQQIVGAYHQLQSEFAKPLANALTPWFSVARSLIGVLPGLVGPAIGAFGDLGKAILPLIQSHAFKDFINTLGQFGAFAATEFASAGIEIARAFGNILLAFMPLARIILPGIVELATKFELWSSKLGSSSGFHEFITYVIANGPLVGQLLVNLVKIFINLGIALAPLGAILLKFLTWITKILAAMSPNELLAIVFAVGVLGVVLAAAFAGVPLLIAAVVAAVVALAALLVNMWPSIKHAWSSAIQWLHDNFVSPLANFFTKDIPAALDIWKESVRIVCDDIEILFLKLVANILNTMGKLPGPLGAPFRKAHADIGVALAAIEKDVANSERKINSDWQQIHGRHVTLSFGLGLPAGVSIPGARTGQRTAPIPGHARGTSGAKPGWALVGELGPELVSMRGGETVIPHGPSMQALNGYADGTSGWSVTDSFQPGVGQFISGLNAANVAAQKAIVNYVNKNAKLPAVSIGGFQDTGARSGSAALAQAYAASIIGNYGWGANQMSSLIPLWNQESGWNAYAVNPSSGAYGIPQSLGHGHPYNLGDYKAQILWGLSYIAGRYGSPAAAEAHELAAGWYDRGGPLPPGGKFVMNGTGRTEEVLTPDERLAFIALAKGGKGNDMTGLERRLERLITAVQNNAGATGMSVADALNGTARKATYRSAYSAQDR